jgi:hypothetical protein
MDYSGGQHHLAESVAPEWAVLVLVAAFAVGLLMAWPW